MKQLSRKDRFCAADVNGDTGSCFVIKLKGVCDAGICGGKGGGGRTL